MSTLYPFEETAASGADDDAIIEKIDIGGPAMVACRREEPRHAVEVITEIAQYGEVHKAIADGGFTLEQRRRLAAQAYAHTAAYDAAVSSLVRRKLRTGRGRQGDRLAGPDRPGMDPR